MKWSCEDRAQRSAACNSSVNRTHFWVSFCCLQGSCTYSRGLTSTPQACVCSQRARYCWDVKQMTVLCCSAAATLPNVDGIIGFQTHLHLCCLRAKRLWGHAVRLQQQHNNGAAQHSSSFKATRSLFIVVYQMQKREAVTVKCLTPRREKLPEGDISCWASWGCCHP